MRDWILKGSTTSSSAEECESSEVEDGDEEHGVAPVVENPMQAHEIPQETETLAHTHSNASHTNTSTTSNQSTSIEVP